VQMGDPSMATTMLREAMTSSLRPMIEEPLKTLVTAIAVFAARTLSPASFSRVAGSFSGGRLVA
jgi:hypothetical protein